MNEVLKMTDEEVVIEMNRIFAYNRGWDACMNGGSFQTSVYRYDTPEFEAYQKGWLAYARSAIAARNKTP